jgi:hypothetical protein
MFGFDSLTAGGRPVAAHAAEAIETRRKAMRGFIGLA